jgi:Flp pilus assembly protein TadD
VNRERWQSLAVFAIACGLYCNTLPNEFTNWDDPILVINNARVRSFDVAAILTPQAGHTYQSVRELCYALIHSVAGLRPAAYHITNLLLHAVASVLLLAGLTRLVDNRRVAFFATLLFVVHPVNVEAVAWISSLKYVLLSTFSFAALLMHLRSSQIWAVTFAVLALLSSPFAITLPVLFLLVDYCRAPEVDPRVVLRRCWRAHLPTLIGFSVLSLILARALFGGEGGPGLAGAHIEGRADLTLFTMLRVLTDYAINLALPLWLNAKYPNALVADLFHPKVLVAILGLAAVFWFAWREARSGNKRPLLCFGWAMIAWAPVSNIVPISTTMADRYLYLPAVGLFLGLALALDWTLRSRRLPVKPLYSVSVFLLLILSGLTLRRNTVWRSSFTLWADSLARSESNPTALRGMGNALLEADRDDEAIVYLKRAVQLFEPFPDAHQSLGSYYVRRRDCPNARRHLERALELRSDIAETHSNLGICQAQTGDPVAAIRSFRRAIELLPIRAEFYINLGAALRATGQVDAAVAEFAKGAEMANDARAYVDAGLTLGRVRRDAEALPYFEKALALQPQEPRFHKHLGISLANLGQLRRAEQALARAHGLYVSADDPKAAEMATLLVTIRAQISQNAKAQSRRPPQPQ